MGGPKSRAHIPLSEKEKLAMAFAFQCMPEFPKLDMDKWKDLAGYTTVASANFAWLTIKAKLEYIAANGNSGDDAQPPSTPKSAKATPKRKAKNAGDSDDENDDGEEPASPPKKKSPRKKAAVKTTKVKAEPAEEDDGNDTDFLDKVLDRHDSTEEV